MRISEITDAQGQLELLRTVIDNTWTAIAQQAEQEKRADAERKAQAKLKPRSKKATKAPYAPPPTPLKKPKPTLSKQPTPTAKVTNPHALAPIKPQKPKTPKPQRFEIFYIINLINNNIYFSKLSIFQKILIIKLSLIYQSSYDNSIGIIHKS